MLEALNGPGKKKQELKRIFGPCERERNRWMDKVT
jgi:hypothetical protein